MGPSRWAPVDQERAAGDWKRRCRIERQSDSHHAEHAGRVPEHSDDDPGGRQPEATNFSSDQVLQAPGELYVQQSTELYLLSTPSGSKFRE